MSSAFGIVYIVTESENVLMKFIDVLKGNLNVDPVTAARKIHRLTYRLFVGIQIFNETDYAVGFMKFFLFIGTTLLSQ